MTIQNLAWRGFFSMALLLVSSAAQAQPTIAGVSNGASFQPTFSPGSLAAVFGTNLTVTGSTTTVTVGSIRVRIVFESVAMSSAGSGAGLGGRAWKSPKSWLVADRNATASAESPPVAGPGAIGVPAVVIAKRGRGGTPGASR